jgi:dTDP-4-amino-4,6-dideoxygalactose transaminase
MKKIDYIEPISLTDLSLKDIPKYLKGKSVKTQDLAIKEFENTLAKYLKVKYCVSVNSGTTGLMLAIKALGISKEVIVPSYTFCGTVHPLTWNGLTPRFVDIDRRTFNIDLDKVRKSITSKTSAILAVHLYGNPCDIESLEAIAHEHDLKLIFDSASAFGSKYKGRMLGGFGDLEVFSLQAQKILNVLEGGFISTNQEVLYKKLLMLRSQGNRGNGDCLYVGLNARMHPLAAILGLASLKNFDKNIRERQRLGGYYHSLLSRIPGVEFQTINDQAQYNYQYMPLLIDKKIFGLSRDELMQKLEKKGIAARKYFHPPVNRYSCYSHLKKHFSLKVSDYVADNIICFPFYSSMGLEDIEYICRVIHKQKKLLQDHILFSLI